jgi:SAM-dependent methyltransferase
MPHPLATDFKVRGPPLPPQLAKRAGEGWATRVYETNAGVYQPVLEAGLKTAPGEVRGIARLLKDGGVGDGSEVLDVACGIGRHSVFLAKAGYRVTGVDRSAAFLARARRLAREEGARRARFVRGSFSNVSRAVARPKGGFAGIILMDNSVGVTADEKDDLRLFNDLHGLAAERSSSWWRYSKGRPSPGATSGRWCRSSRRTWYAY